MKKSLEVAE